MNLINWQNLTLVGKDSEWFWGFMQFVAVTTTLFLIYRQIRLQNASHVVAALTAINERWNSENMMATRNRVCQRWVSNDIGFDVYSQLLAEFFEEMGLYVKLRMISRDVVWEIHSWSIECYWAIFESGIKALRADRKDLTAYSSFEILITEMKKVSKKHKLQDFTKTREELDSFARAELKTVLCALDKTPPPKPNQVSNVTPTA